MDIQYDNGWMYFYEDSCRLEIQLNPLLERNIGILKKNSNDIDNVTHVTKGIYLFYDMRLNHWKQEDLKKVIKILELFLRGTKVDKDLLYTLPYKILQEIYYHRKQGGTL